jgi:cytochrome c oxidase subunit 2
VKTRLPFSVHRFRLPALLGWPAALGLALFAALPAWAQNPSARVTNAFSNPASNVAHWIRNTSWAAFWIIIPFIALAEVLLVYVIFKFRRRPNDPRQPAKFHDNPGLEITWTVLPILALVFVALIGYRSLKKIDFGPAPNLNVVVIGHRFFWEYRYPKYGIDFSNQALVVPANRNVSLQITSVDVIHGFYVPGLGLQMDAVPGRISHVWFNARPGTYQGQCAQLCGPLHGEMFLTVKVLPPPQFVQWLAKHASSGGAAQAVPPRLPAAKHRAATKESL